MRCIVKDCKNHEHEGKFVGSLCFPCHEYITKADGRHSQAYRNTQRTWVELTDDDCLEALKAVDPETKRLPLALSMFAANIQAKLKEKNCG